MSRIADMIVLGDPTDQSYFTNKFHKTCTDEELDELWHTFHSWVSLVFYNAKYKAKCRRAMASIEKEQNKRKNKK